MVAGSLMSVYVRDDSQSSGLETSDSLIYYDKSYIVLRAVVEDSPSETFEETATVLHSTYSTIHRHLQSLGYVSRLGKWESLEVIPQ